MWSSSITEEESQDIERVQKVAMKIILKEYYTCYEDSLNITGLEKLKSRRKMLSLNFAKKCLKNEKMASLFPLNPGYNENSRISEKQAGAELGQAQLKLGLDLTSTSLH